MAVDLREPEAPAAVVAAAVAHFGRLDLLVNNAGATKRGDFLTLSEPDWEDGFRLKFFGAVRGCRAAWPHLQTTHGAIVNIVGIGGRTGTAEFAIGGAVNAALLNLTKVLADRGVRDGVRVNAINPDRSGPSGFRRGCAASRPSARSISPAPKRRWRARSASPASASRPRSPASSRFSRRRRRSSARARSSTSTEVRRGRCSGEAVTNRAGGRHPP